MSKILLFLTMVFLATSPVSASMAEIKAAVDELHQAIATKNLLLLEKKIPLDQLVRSKIKKYSRQAQAKGNWVGKSAGKLAQLGEGAVTAAATKFIRREFSRSTPALRQHYLKGLVFTKYGEKGNYGFASGSFLGRPAYLSLIKNKNGWLVVGADSPVLDEEFNNLLKILKLR
jgi:hypothetical protein